MNRVTFNDTYSLAKIECDYFKAKMKKAFYIIVLSGFLMNVNLYSRDNHSTVVRAQKTKTEGEKINYLIKSIEDLENAKFIRNGVTYSSKKAAYHLRFKYNLVGHTIRNAEEFIDKLASKSSRTGKLYKIKFENGKIVNLRDFLNDKLKEVQ